MSLSTNEDDGSSHEEQKTTTKIKKIVGQKQSMMNNTKKVMRKQMNMAALKGNTVMNFSKHRDRADNNKSLPSIEKSF